MLASAKKIDEQILKGMYTYNKRCYITSGMSLTNRYVHPADESVGKGVAFHVLKMMMRISRTSMMPAMVYVEPDSVRSRSAKAGFGLRTGTHHSL
jgi:hypothetical protein